MAGLLAGAVLLANPGQEKQPGDEVLAEIEGYQLTQGELDRVLQILPPSVRKQADTPAGKAGFISTYIQQKAMVREALAQKLDQQPEVQLQIRFSREQVLAEALRSRALEQTRVSDEEVEAFYKENKPLFQHPVMVRVNHILVGNRKEAQEVIAQAAEGKSFAELAATHSMDMISKGRGGYLGWVRPGEKEAAFEQVIFDLPVGQISSPIRTKKGWQILQVAERREAGYLPLVEVRETIRSRMLEEKRKAVLNSIARDAFEKHGGKIYGSGQQP